MVSDDFNRVVQELLIEQPGLAADKAEALARTIVGRTGASETAPTQAIRPIVDADLSPRCLAVAVDAGCLAVAYVIIAGLIYITTHLSPPFPSQLILPVVAVLYVLVSWAAFGASPGMYAQDLRLVDDRGNSIRLPRAALRLVVLLVGCLPLGATFVSGVLSQTNRSWHDFVAGTHLINVRERLS